MERGYIRLYRKIFDSGILQNPEILQFWLWLLLKASHKKHVVLVGTIPVTLQPGQLIFGRKTAASELKTTERKIRTRLGVLKKLKNVTIETTNRFSVVTIENWEAYQQSASKTTNRATNQRPANDQPAATNKNGKKGKKTSSLSEFKKRNPDAHIFSSDFSKWGTADDEKLAEYIYQKLKQKYPKTKKPKMGEWANHIRLMRTQDKHTHKEIQDVFLWAHTDDFWTVNILSPAKLRKQFGQLHTKMGSSIDSEHYYDPEQDAFNKAWEKQRGLPN